MSTDNESRIGVGYHISYYFGHGDIVLPWANFSIPFLFYLFKIVIMNSLCSEYAVAVFMLLWLVFLVCLPVPIILHHSCSCVYSEMCTNKVISLFHMQGGQLGKYGRPKAEKNVYQNMHAFAISVLLDYLSSSVC